MKSQIFRTISVLEKVEACHKFLWLVPVSGLLRLEMIAFSSFIKLAGQFSKNV